MPRKEREMRVIYMLAEVIMAVGLADKIIAPSTQQRLPDVPVDVRLAWIVPDKVYSVRALEVADGISAPSGSPHIER